jgi:diguanylate cyclase (GGDEF)-like protein
MATLPSLEHLNPEHLPDSPLVHELRKVSRLRFEGDLERRYLATHLKRVRLRVRLWFTTNLALSVLYSVVQVFRTGFNSADFGLHFFVVFPCAAALAWLVWGTEYERLFLPVSRVLVPLWGAAVAFFIAPLIGNGHDEELANLTVYVIAAFFFSGLMFRTALCAALAIVAAFGATALALGPISTIYVKSLLVLGITAAMSATVYYDVERSARRNFLEDALIAEMVERDGLTGLMNRRALDGYLLRVWQQAQRDHRTLAVLMIDIDHFKAYNDSYGHQAGDAALCAVARLLKTFTRRPLDFAARYGGEEFVVFLYDMQQSYVQDVAERIRQSVEHLVVPDSVPGNVPGVTVSVGAGVVEPMLGRTPQGALQFADETLYEAKRAGRNCVIFRGVEDYHKIKTGPFRTLERALRSN